MRKLVAILSMLVAAAGVVNAAESRYDIIPKPASLQEKDGCFTLTKNSCVSAEGDSLFTMVAGDLSSQLRTVTGYPVRCCNSNADIVIEQVDGFAPEGYSLEVGKTGVRIQASSAAGAFYGVQTLLQLFPSKVYGSGKVKGVKWQAACCSIKDEPKFPYRGLMLDCGRYFMPKETVKAFINVMAMHKQNMFHWHLTEDQGWRLEIKKYPRLTEVGSKRPFTADYHDADPDGVPHEGYYSQDDVREIVEYARHRFVTVIPEIEIPGHSSAAIAAYPELSCDTTRHYEVATSWGVKKDVYCPNAATFRFLEDVFTEMFDLFPSPIYHIGGDECPKDAWKNSQYCRDLKEVLDLESWEDMQTFFVKRMGNFLARHGKRVMGWDEILDGGAVPGAIAESYRGHAPAARGIRRGNDVVLAPNRWCYLDYYQEDPETEHKSQNLLITLKKAYSYYPCVDSLPELSEKYIIGIEGCVWGEYDENSARAEYLAFPRDIALSEDGWVARSDKDWDSFRARLEKDLARLDVLDINYSRSYYNVIFDYDCITKKRPDMVDLLLSYPDATIHYTLDGSAPTAKSPVFTEPFKPEAGTLVRAQGFKSNGRPVGKPVQKKF